MNLDDFAAVCFDAVIARNRYSEEQRQKSRDKYYKHHWRKKMKENGKKAVFINQLRNRPVVNDDNINDIEDEWSSLGELY